MKQELVLKEKLPEGWKWSTLGKECDIKIGGTPSRGNSEYFKGSNLWVSVSDLNGTIINDTRERITDDGIRYSNAKLVKKGTVLVCFKLSLGKKGIAGQDLYTNEAIAALEIKPESNLTNKFLFYYLDKINFFDYSNTAAKGSCLNKDILATVKILVPSKEDIKQIVSKLDAQMAQIEIMKTEAEKEKGASEIFSESILKAVFNNPNYKKDKIKTLCSVNPRKPELKYSDETETSFIPMESVNQEKGIIDLPQVKPFGKIKKGYTYFEENDVLFAKITPCMQNKKSAIAKNLINGFGFGTTEFHVLKANSKILPELLLYYVREGSFIGEAKSHFTGAVGQQRVPKEFIEEYEILYPESKEEQIKLLRKIEKSNDEIHKINEMINKKLSAISLLPTSLLNEVFGKYDIPEVK